jgi:hypothetical protein
MASDTDIDFFDRVVDLARIKRGNRQTIDTLISEEAVVCEVFERRKERLDSNNRN